MVCIGKTKCTVQVKDVYYKKDISLFKISQSIRRSRRTSLKPIFRGTSFGVLVHNDKICKMVKRSIIKKRFGKVYRDLYRYCFDDLTCCPHINFMKPNCR